MKIKRYRKDYDYMEEDEEGIYVMYDDIKYLLESPAIHSDNICDYCDIDSHNVPAFMKCKTCTINNYCNFQGKKLEEVKI